MDLLDRRKAQDDATFIGGIKDAYERLKTCKFRSAGVSVLLKVRLGPRKLGDRDVQPFLAAGPEGFGPDPAASCAVSSINDLS